MSVTVSKLRRNIYQILDRIIETGQPLEIERKGTKLKITKSKSSTRLGRLPKRDCIKGNPEGLVSIDWSHEWKP